MSTWRIVHRAVLLVLLTSGCSVQRFAVNRVGDAIAGGGTTFSADNDPELVRDAVPFSLKLTESLLAESPRHRGLLLTAVSGFTQYSYGFIQQEADEIEASDLAKARGLRERARKMYLRARDYGLRGLELRQRNFIAALRADPRAAANRIRSKADVPFLYWTAAAWGSVIALSKNDPETVADLPIVEALIDRALALDERFEAGAVHSFLITYEMARRGGAGDPVVRARPHFDRAVALSQGQLAGPFVSWAEQVDVARQNHKEFETMLARALAIVVDARPEWRLQNLIMQRRARWLLERESELFLE